MKRFRRLSALLVVIFVLMNPMTVIANGEIVNVLVDSRYYVEFSQLLMRTPLLSYENEIYAPLQGLFEVHQLTYEWDEYAKTAKISHNDYGQSELDEIASKWMYPSLWRGFYRPDYVQITEFESQTGKLVCTGSERRDSHWSEEIAVETYSFLLDEQEIEEYSELISSAMDSGEMLRLVAFFPFPLAAGAPPPPEAFAPIFIELTTPYSETQQAEIVNISINTDSFYGIYDKNGNPTHPLLSIKTLNFDGELYASVLALSEVINYWSYGYIGTGDDIRFAVKEPAYFLKLAVPTISTVYVNGEKTAFDSYNIDGYNYFKLRDLAYVLNGTQKQFEVKWIGDTMTVMLVTGESYTVVGGEMTGKGANNKNAELTHDRILLDGEEASFVAFRIESNNYFKLREIAEAFDFGVVWNDEDNSIYISTSGGYTPE